MVGERERGRDAYLLVDVLLLVLSEHPAQLGVASAERDRVGHVGRSALHEF
jgi:hypothetical protein